MFSSALQFVSIMLVAITLLGCTPTGGGKSPLPPTIGPTLVNGTIWPNEPLTVYFSDHGTQTESVNTVALNDLYFANPYAFQIQLGYQFPALGFEIQENGNTLSIMPARTNTKSRPSKIDPNNGRVLEWDWPYPANMVARGQPPTSTSSYSIETVNTCAGRLASGNAPCSNPGAILLLTISPPTQPAKPTHGQVFEYTLIEKGSGNYSGQIATTVIRAIYIEPNRCQIRNLLLQPTTGKAGEVVTAEFEATDCRRVKLTAGSDLLFDRVAPTFADNIIDSRRFALPKTTSITVRVDAFDSMMRSAAPRSGRVNIDPCSISATHPQCPLNCTATPNDSRCPANCTANPNDPRCATPCPRTTDNPNGEYKAWDTGMYCGTFQIIPTKISGCTFDAAKQSFPPPLGCVYTTITGKPIGECTSGLPKQDFDMCLSCTAQGSTTPTKEYVVERNACSLNDARDSAINARRPRSCVFVSAGLCP
ncbi:hypothetical protein [Cellvibrio sp. pealriver]|uniref:hypothetical protein n=1 Tax=Cellvibrio sp. pealriver TaxID=1622269 RepID=UPI00066FF36E|nr:hypothetical protein [Cellvibrio sp. pealriver]